MKKAAPKKPANYFAACSVCGELFDRRRYKDGVVVGTSRDTKTCPAHRWQKRGAKRGIIDRATPYAVDVACQIFVSTFRGGATFDSIAEAMGISRERVRQIQEIAFAKLEAQGIRIFGIDPTDPDERRDGDPRHDEPGGADADPDQEEEPPAVADLFGA